VTRPAPSHQPAASAGSTPGSSAGPSPGSSAGESPQSSAGESPESSAGESPESSAGEAPPAPAPARVDGRTARAERTRKAIVDAHLQLIREGDLRPTADRIAKLAGVSLRALWSHFADMEALFAESGQRILEERDGAHQPISAALPLADRIDAYCRQRARLLEQIGPAAKAASLKEPFSETLRRYRRLHVVRIREELATLFAAEIGGDEQALDALTAVSMWPTWSAWREVMDLSAEAAQATLTRTVTALVGSPRS
jgi:TetR/AcrR family transcriptional regulator, regulator of autoinduction and epiphytic fitness